MSFVTELISRVKGPTPKWFKNIAWICSMIAVVCGSLWLAQETNQICISAPVFNILKIVTVAAGAVAGVSMTANDKK